MQIFRDEGIDKKLRVVTYSRIQGQVNIDCGNLNQYSGIQREVDITCGNL